MGRVHLQTTLNRYLILI